jgi:hypothetical protein
MSALPHFNLTPEEYLELERKAEFRSEYSDGCACVMAGASENDNIITLNTASVLLANLRGKTTFAREWLPKRTMWENFRNADMITAEMRLTDSDSVTLLARARKLRPTQLTIWTEFRAA